MVYGKHASLKVFGICFSEVILILPALVLTPTIVLICLNNLFIFVNFELTSHLLLLSLLQVTNCCGSTGTAEDIATGEV